MQGVGSDLVLYNLLIEEGLWPAQGLLIAKAICSNLSDPKNIMSRFSCPFGDGMNIVGAPNAPFSTARVVFSCNVHCLA